MNHDELKRVLGEKAEIVPSAGFVKGVMDAVRNETSAPPPIPFPWLRALPGMVAGVLALAALIVVVVREANRGVTAPMPESAFMRALTDAASLADTYGAGWILLGTAVTVVCVALSMRLATGRWRAL